MTNQSTRPLTYSGMYVLHDASKTTACARTADIGGCVLRIAQVPRGSRSAAGADTIVGEQAHGIAPTRARIVSLILRCDAAVASRRCARIGQF